MFIYNDYDSLTSTNKDAMRYEFINFVILLKSFVIN